MIHDKFREISEELEGGRRHYISVRELLSWFDAQRRGVWVNERIKSALKACQLTTEPDFEFAYIDSPVEFVRVNETTLVSHAGNDAGLTEDATTSVMITQIKSVEIEIISDSKPAINDPMYRIGKLPAANRPPLYVKPDERIERATTLMLAHDYSLLPVMTNEREVKGVVSWRSIGVRLGLGHQGTYVREYMEPHKEVSSDVSIFSVINLIIESDAILVRDRERKISGIVTTSDLSCQFSQLGRPFLLLGQIENQIRRLIGPHFSPSELSDACDPNDVARKHRVQTVSDLTFGEYLRLLGDSDRWARLGLRIDRPTFINQLDEVRRIRNDVMHFDPDGIGEDDLSTLQRFDQFLQQLSLIIAVA